MPSASPAWGAAIPTRSGDYVYTSFSSYGFLAPCLGLKLVGATPSLHSLALFNVVFGALCSLLLLRLVYVALRAQGSSRATAALAAWWASSAARRCSPRACSTGCRASTS